MPHLPSSSVSRSAAGHLRLLSAVDLYAPPGLQFRGKLLRPGAMFDPVDLPHPAVILECAGSSRTASAKSRYSFETLWILWAFDFAAGEWRESMRAHSRDSAFTLDFAPAAHRLLYTAPVPIAQDRVRPIVHRLALLIDEDLASVSTEERCAVLAGIETHIANEIVHAVARMPERSEWVKRLAATA